MRKLGLLVGLLIAWSLLIGCGKPSVQGPSPLPSVLPSPSPSPNLRLTSVLHIDGHEFRDDRNETVYLLGAVGAGAPGDGTNGWPLVSHQVIDQIADAGLNWTEIRIGPFSSNMPQGAAFSWDSPSLLSVAGEAIAYANSKGVWVSVVLNDAWCAQHNCAPFPLWELGGNPNEFQEAWARKVVAALGGNPGVLWVDANEGFKNPSSEFSINLMKIVQDEEEKKGFRRHPFGTNSHMPAVEYQVDFIVKHQNGAATLGPMNQPLMVTEHDEEQSAEETIRQALRARDFETSYMRFRGDLSDSEWKYVLTELGKIRRGE